MNDDNHPDRLKFLFKLKSFLTSSSRPKIFFRLRRALILLVVLLSIPVTVFLIRNQQDIRNRAATPEDTWQSYDNLVKENKIKPATKVLEIGLIYNEDNFPQLGLAEIKQKNGYAPTYPLRNEGYELKVVDNQDQVLYSLKFTVPNIVLDPPGISGNNQKKDKAGKPLKLTETNFVLTIPWFDSGKEIDLYNQTDELIAVKALSRAQKINNQPAFNSITGESFLRGKQSGTIKTENSFPKKVSAATTDYQYADIAFVGDDYTDMNQFHNDVNRFISNFLTYEPFSTRASQIRFYYIDNTSDLGCYYSGGRLILCDNNAISSVVNNSGVPHDNIFVIYNNSTYGGAGYIDGSLAYGYNGLDWGAQVFVHEFGHSFGGLWDEYAYDSTPGVIDGQTRANCYAGTPPATDWQGIVGPADYNLGCTYPNWYRSSASSIMIYIEVTFFNPLSKTFLNRKIDYFTTPPTPTPTPTPKQPTPTPTPTPMPTPTNTPTPKLTPTPGVTQIIPTPTPTNVPTPTPTPMPTNSLTASSISLNYVTKGQGYSISTKVTVIDEKTGAYVSSANVLLTITTPSTGAISYSTMSNKNGIASFKMNAKEKGTYTVTIDDIRKTSYSYHPTTTSQTLNIN